jgi:hypothetical protein
LPNPFAADAVNRLQVLLFHAFDRHEPQVRPTDRCADAFGVVGVVLPALHLRFDKLRRDQADRVAHPLKHPTPMMRARACFHPDPARCEFLEKLLHLIS